MKDRKMCDWMPIETFPGETGWTEYKHSPGTRYYDDVLVYGPRWTGSWSDSPEPDDEHWTGDMITRIGTTWNGEGYFTSVGNAGPVEYDEYVKPTHWMPLPEPPVGAPS